MGGYWYFSQIMSSSSVCYQFFVFVGIQIGNDTEIQRSSAGVGMLFQIRLSDRCRSLKAFTSQGKLHHCSNYQEVQQQSWKQQSHGISITETSTVLGMCACMYCMLLDFFKLLICFLLTSYVTLVTLQQCCYHFMTLKANTSTLCY